MTGGVQFRILGPVEADVGGVPLLTGLRRRERCLLAVLLLEAGRVIPTARLIDLLWDSTPPPGARSLLHTHVSHLRQRLSRQDARALVTRGDGYLLDVDAAAVDALSFRAMVTRACLVPEPAARIDLLGQALALWRGPALADVASESLRKRVCAGLTELRLTAIEDRAGLCLAMGRHRETISELYDVLAEHPLRERAAGLLMQALYRGGEQSEALAVFHSIRSRLAEEVGLDPGQELLQVHHAIVRRDAAVPPPGAGDAQVAPITPAQLPAAVSSFVGRQRDLDRLDALAPGPLTRASTPPRAVVICGTAGVGKTALAVTWAHRVAPAFPDGQLYIDLHGYSPEAALAPGAALDRLLRALGVAGDQLPVDQDEQAALFRSVLGDRRVLLVLDNAASVDQIRPLLPGSAPCFTIVTSRSDLRGLLASHDAHRIGLQPLERDEAVSLLARLVGEDRVAREPSAADELAELCARLPLALRVAAANLAADSEKALADAADELAAGDRLAKLAMPGDEQTAVRAAFVCSYRVLPAEARRLFRLLGLIPGPDFTRAAVAAMAGLTPGHCAELLEALCAAHLIERRSSGGRGEDRLQCHDLLRWYAAERAEAEDPASRAGAIDRLLRFYVYQADAAAMQLYPHLTRLPCGPAALAAGTVDRAEAVDGADPAGAAKAGQIFAGAGQVFASHHEALAWLDAERANLLAAIHCAARHPAHEAAWLLADALRGYFLSFSATDAQWHDSACAALVAARRAKRSDAEAAMHRNLGSRYFRHGHYDHAAERFRDALAAAQAAGLGDAEAGAHLALGLTLWAVSDLREAVDHYQKALVTYRAIDDRGGEAETLDGLGNVYGSMGEPWLAMHHHRKALALHRASGSRLGQARSLNNLSCDYLAMADVEQAVTHATEALRLSEDLSSTFAQGKVLVSLASAHREAGRHRQAMECLQHARELSRANHDLAAETGALTELAAVCLAIGRPLEAVDQYEHALELAGQLSDARAEASALAGLAETRLDLGQYDEALAAGHRALALARPRTLRHLEGRALAIMANAHRAQGRVEQARPLADEALAICRRIGHRTTRARVLTLLGGAA
jgi:DNA-binding SARP family transcriptional activator/tetratricopeptide (TPR) repeat protein